MAEPMFPKVDDKGEVKQFSPKVIKAFVNIHHIGLLRMTKAMRIVFDRAVDTNLKPHEHLQYFRAGMDYMRTWSELSAAASGRPDLLKIGAKQFYAGMKDHEVAKWQRKLALLDALTSEELSALEARRDALEASATHDDRETSDIEAHRNGSRGTPPTAGEPPVDPLG